MAFTLSDAELIVSALRKAAGQCVQYRAKGSVVIVHCAEPLTTAGAATGAEDLVLLAVEPPPDFGQNWRERSREHEGTVVADAIVRHLPGGTVDQILVALLRHKATSLVVPLQQPTLAAFMDVAGGQIADAIRRNDDQTS